MNEPTQYIMLGGDGKEYGPVSAVELQQWINEGRANMTTRVKPVGTDEWKAVADCGEFVALPAGVAPLPPPRPQAPVAIKVFGVLNTVFGGMGVLCSPMGFLAGPILEKQYGAGSPILKWFLFANVLGIIGGAVLLTSGIGLLRQRAWAPRLAAGYAALAIVLAIVSSAVMLMYTPAAGNGPTDQIQRVATTVGAVGGTIFNLLYNGVLIFFLTRPAVKAYLASPRER